MENRIEQKISQSSEERTLKDLSVNVAALLCYVGGWISGIVFLVLEQKNRFIRFHALQSIIVFGTLTLASAILGHIPFVGLAFAWTIGVLGFALWLTLIINANAGKVFKLPWAGDLAEKLSLDRTGQPLASNIDKPGAYENTNTAEPVSPPKVSFTQQETFKGKYYSSGARAGRIVGSSFAIAWSIALLVFFNLYSQYIAYYQPNSGADASQWQMYTLITTDFNTWLPILNVTLVFSIIGHILSISFDKYILRQIVHIMLDVFGLATVATLVAIFPFNFNVIPNPDVAYWAQIGVTVTLILMAVGFGIGALVKFIQLIVNAIQDKI